MGSLSINKRLFKVFKARPVAGQSVHHVAFQPGIIDQFVEVARRPKFRKYFSLTDLNVLLQQLSLQAALIMVTRKVTARRDPEDTVLLFLAMDAGATPLITGDNDLPDIQIINDTITLNIADYRPNA